MKCELEVKKYRENIADLELTVDKLQQELKLSKEATGQASSVNEAATVADVTNDNIEGADVQQRVEVSVWCS